MSLAVVSFLVVLTACSGRTATSAADKTIKSTTSGDTTIAISSASGEARSGENDLVLSFTDPSGKFIDVPAASLKFYMPAMGAMAEMNDVATLTTTDSPGRFKVRVNIEVPGSWEAIISYQGSRGTERATMTVTAK
jgi:hypothetical protein